jgi:hypothetical protein
MDAAAELTGKAALAHPCASLHHILNPVSGFLHHSAIAYLVISEIPE